MKENSFTKLAHIEVPVLCGAMYPCSNPELVAAVSEAGGMGIVQPLSLTYVWGHDFRLGLRAIKSLTSKPFGMNALLEKTSRTYERRMLQWIEIALEEGCRFFVTALGNPREVVKLVKAHGATVFHDVTELKWAQKAMDAGVDGLVCVNNRAGGHAGTRSAETLVADLAIFKCPLICAGGIGNEIDFAKALNLGYSGVQMGTRFIATKECSAHDDYKRAIIEAAESDIVLTERVTGIPLSVIRTPYVDAVGTKAGRLAKFFLRYRFTKEWARLVFNVGSLIKMKRSVKRGLSTKDYWQAGKSVATIQSTEPVAELMKRFRDRWESIGS